MRMKMQQSLLSAIIVMSSSAMALAQAPAGAPPGGGRGPGGPPRPVLTVTSPAWADGGEVPMNNAGRGGNKSPEFEFHWSVGNTPADTPAALKTYAVIFHDIENV